MSASFWFVAGVLTGVTASAVAIASWRGLRQAQRSTWLPLAIGAGGIFAAGAAVVFLAMGSPHSRDEAAATLPSVHPATATDGNQAPSMEAATERLETRLRQSGGSAQDWQLLAQSYDFLGRKEDAQRARAAATSAGSPQPTSITDATLAAARTIMPGELAASAPGPSRDQPAPPSLSDLEERVRSSPRDASAWLALADAQRERRQFTAARAAFQKAIALHGMTAQSWADYADVVGSASGGTLNDEAAKAIAQSLTLDPVNAKALWLEASRAHQQHRHSDALQVWMRLRSVLPEGSPDIAPVQANIAEAAQLAGLPSPVPTGGTATLIPGAPAPPVTQGAVDAASEISGTVSIDLSLAARVERGAVLFIYAKAADSPGPPLAVARVAAGTWPVSFRLDDTMAMLPSRRLSQFQRVIIEARVSRSGQATPQPGDLYVTSDVVTPSAGKRLALVINRQIG
jgi:cytochrome c-type biogenesis protein CcmH